MCLLGVKGNKAVLLRWQTQLNVTLRASNLRDFVASVSLTTSSFQSYCRVMVHSIKSDITDWCTNCSSTLLWNRFWLCRFNFILWTTTLQWSRCNCSFAQGFSNAGLEFMQCHSLAGTLVSSSSTSSIQEPCIDHSHIKHVKEQTVVPFFGSQFVAVQTN